MAKTAKQFISQFKGKAIDIDGAYGVQCVDGFKAFCKWMGYPVKATGNGWADGYWYNRATQGYAKYFDFITDTTKLQEGDWLFWAFGSKDCPYSHVAMFVQYDNASKTKGSIFGQNQGAKNGAFNTVANHGLGILGAFRPKEWSINQDKAKEWVNLLYTNILGRKADTNGLNGWTASLVNGTQAKVVINGFFNSSEYKKRNTSNEQFVVDCYKGCLNRKPDKAGEKAWLDKLNKKTSRQTVLNGFTGSAEFAKFVAKYGLK